MESGPAHTVSHAVLINKTWHSQTWTTSSPFRQHWQKYLVSCAQYSVGVDITIGPYAVYSELFPFEIFIGGPSFEIKGQSVRPLTLNLTITVYSVAAMSGWSFEKPPVSATSNISAYATGLCQSPWSGVTCLKGEVVGLKLKGSE